MLKQRLTDAGLAQYSARTVDELRAKYASSREHGLTKDNFEPFIGALQAIICNAVDPSTDHMSVPRAYEGCPLCWLHEHCPCGGAKECKHRIEEFFLGNAVEDELESAKEFGLVLVS